ncbi:hypothetical protein KM043_005360 [Ampulex compressa]|nr:hypothetical protein KM043_005360 [Ampulex compressa]
MRRLNAAASDDNLRVGEESFKQLLGPLLEAISPSSPLSSPLSRFDEENITSVGPRRSREFGSEGKIAQNPSTCRRLPSSAKLGLMLYTDFVTPFRAFGNLPKLRSSATSNTSAEALLGSLSSAAVSYTPNPRMAADKGAHPVGAEGGEGPAEEGDGYG